MISGPNRAHHASPWLVTLFGRPGSGKTEVGDWLARDYGFVHLAMGRMLKDPAIIAEIGIDEASVRLAVATGRTIDQPQLLEWLDARISGSDQPVVVDGYPRVPAAINSFNRLVERVLIGWSVVALHLVCDPAVAAVRVNRRGRDDDRLIKLDIRNEEYMRVQLPLLNRLSPRVQLVEIDAVRGLQDVLGVVRNMLSTRLPTAIAGVGGWR
jgi:adenylate kinase family enzyme